MNRLVQPNDEVQDALDRHRPIVALESTLIAHGFPPDRRRHIAATIEDAVRSYGGVPATLLVHDGAIHVGLNDRALDRLEHPDPIVKASIDRLPQAIASGATAATTVSSSILIAALAGIDVFSTGGLGGVHRGAAESFDVSGDLGALAKYSTVVVTAGVKSILDVPATVEALETLGVTVLTLGSDAFPAYYVADSGATATRIDTPADAARTLTARRALDMSGSVLLACPPPGEHQLDPDEHESLLQYGLADAATQGVAGADVTPILLRHLNEATGGRSSQAGLAITMATANIATQVATALT